MHLLVVALSSADGPSGVCRHACNIVRSALMHAQIERVEVIVGKWQKAYFTNWFLSQGVRVSLISIDIDNNSISKNLWYLFTLPKVANQLKTDVVNLAYPVPIARIFFDCPVVVSLHDLYPYDQPRNFDFPNLFFNRVFLLQCLEQVDSVLCVSEATMTRLKVRIPRIFYQKSLVLYNCVDISNTDEMAPIVKSPFFLVVAQHRANKNIQFAVDAFGQMLEAGEVAKETQLFIVGNDGPETPKIKGYIERLNLKKRVHFFTRLSDAELYELYRGCEALLAPSSTEGFCLPIVEALHHGSRVVCSDIPVFREIGEGACHYFDLQAVSPPGAMRAAILKALGEKRRAMVRPERFSLENAASKYLSIYEHVIRLNMAK